MGLTVLLYREVCVHFENLYCYTCRDTSFPSLPTLALDNLHSPIHDPLTCHVIVCHLPCRREHDHGPHSRALGPHSRATDLCKGGQANLGHLRGPYLPS